MACPQNGFPDDLIERCEAADAVSTTRKNTAERAGCGEASGQEKKRRRQKLRQPERAKKKWLKNTRGPYAGDVSAVVFTDHALDKFVLRALKIVSKNMPFADITADFFDNSEKLARQILAESREEKPSAHHVRRIIEHDFVETRYFVSACGWRFVIIKDRGGAEVVVTVERVKPEEN